MSSRVNYFYNSLSMHVLDYRQFTIVPTRSFRFNVYAILRIVNEIRRVRCTIQIKIQYCKIK